MSQSRRGFLGMLGAGVAATVTGFTGRQLTAQDVESTPDEGTLWKTETFEDGVAPVKGDTTHTMDEIWPIKNDGILRIAHHNSTWVRNEQVKHGHFFSHKPGSVECVDLGDRLYVRSIHYLGQRAIEFNSNNQGSEPVRIYTDPDCVGFKRIVENVNRKPYRITHIGVHGPVYGFSVYSNVPSSKANMYAHKHFEFHCFNKSTRHFAAHELGRNFSDGPYILGLKKITHLRMGFEWFVPTLRKI